MDSSYAPTATPKSQTLQAVVEGLFRYISAECDGIERLLETPGLKDISENSSAGQMFEVTTSSHHKKNVPTDLIQQLLIVFLMATISGPEREKFVLAITQLDGPAQSEIATVIVQVLCSFTLSRVIVVLTICRSRKSVVAGLYRPLTWPRNDPLQPPMTSN